MIISNALVWRYFVRGLHSTDSNSTLIPTVISTATNFCTSAILGCIIFQESINSWWWIGALMVISGLYLVVAEDEHNEKNKSKVA